MIDDDSYEVVSKTESCSSLGMVGVVIKVASSRVLDGVDKRALDSMACKALDEINARTLVLDADECKRVADEKAKLLECFDDPIFVEEIPNGYCSEWCCRHRPWFVVTTKVGRITIGWRKRVINIDWSNSAVKGRGSDLFKDETKTTVLEHGIHAWSYDAAKKYLAVLMQSKPNEGQVKHDDGA